MNRVKNQDTLKTGGLTPVDLLHSLKMFFWEPYDDFVFKHFVFI